MNESNIEFLLALVCRDHGHSVVRFALNVPDDQLIGELEWTEGRRQALYVLVGGVTVADLRFEQQQKQYKNAIHGYWSSSGDSIIRTMRSISGGSLPSVDFGVDASQDPAVQRLMRLVNRYELDIQVLAERNDGWRRSPTIFGDHDGTALVAELLARDSLAPLRDALGDDLHSGMRACTLITPTSVSQLYEGMIPEHLLEACASRAMIHGQPLSAESMRKHAQAVVEDFISLMSGEVASVPMSVGAVGSQLLPSSGQKHGILENVEPPDMIAVGDGYLRPTTHMDRRLFTMAKEQIGLVWVTEEETRVDVRPLGDGSLSTDEDALLIAWKDLRAGLTPLGDRWDLVSEAIVLASPEFPPPAWVISEFFKSSVVQPWETSSSSRIAVGDPSRSQVAASDLGDVTGWHQRLCQHPQALRTSRRRLVSALTSRLDPIDALVDAVVAWEGIFSGAPETQMRTVYPSCKLLSHDVNATHTLKAMKTVYGLRSKLVHGDQGKVSDEGVREARDKAIGWVIELLRTLLVEHPTLLQLTAPQRSEAVLVPGTHEAPGSEGEAVGR